MLKATWEVVTKITHNYQMLFALVVVLFVCTHAKASDALILLSVDNPTYQNIAATIIQQGPAISIDITALDKLTEHPGSTLSDYRLLIPIGSKASQLAMQYAPPDSTIVSTFIPSQRFRQLTTTYTTALNKRHISTTAIYLDQPLERQLKLARHIIPKLQRLGFTLGPDSQYRLPQLKQAATDMNLTLNYQTLTLESNPIQRIQPIMESSELFLVIPDQSTLNKTTAKWLLYMSLRNKVPLLAFSQNYVKAGAIAACITLPEDIGRYTAEQLHKVVTGTLPPPSHNPYFKVITNPRVARQLGLSIESAETLQQKLVEQ